jgi:hypothetical protein
MTREIKQVYKVTAHSLNDLVSQLNRIFSLMSERLDEMEGYRGASPFASSGHDHITDAVTTHAFANVESLDALGEKINEILDILETSGLMEA